MRIGIVSGAFEVDSAGRALLEKVAGRADAMPIDPVSFRAEGEEFYAGQERIDRYDALIVRLLNPSGDTEFQFDLLERLAARGVLIVNSPASLSTAESKFLTSSVLSENGIPVPKTLVTQDESEVLVFLERHGDIVVKPIYGFQGRDVLRFRENRDKQAEEIAGLLKEYRGLLVQPYIPNPGRDIRAFVVGGKVVASIFRFAPAGQWKTSVAAGGGVATHELSEIEEHLCLEAAEIIGLDYTGVDLIEGPDGPLVLEVNGSPSWAGVESATGTDIAGSIVDVTLRKLEEKSSQ